MKKFLSLLIAFCLFFTLAGTAFASSSIPDSVETDEKNVSLDEDIQSDEILIGVTKEPLYDLDYNDETYGLDEPTSTWDLGTQGSYNLYGETQGYTLYSNYKFYGQDSYTLLIKNYADTNLIVKFKRGVLLAKRVTVEPGEAITTTYDPLSSTAKFYLQFDGDNINFYGIIY